jgi:NADH-quinone oxidoreductase subunit G
MPRPEQKFVTFEIDGREVSAPEGAMLVDGAKYGDVEIPVFCYEPKLGAPVGACRMCLVEIEGIPKLQTACSTPVKDGMVVTTTSERVQNAQEAVVEFLLVNHPLDCPVCDKGGECPLQDISFGWGAGRSRFIEPKRHFTKPLELSPMVAIDRERCILCYRCVRFSQEIAEDYQLVFLERADHTFVGTHDGHPYVAPFSGNIIELCPVGALTSTAYRFRARPWDIEGAGSLCTLCPSQCNVSFTVRDDTKVLRVNSRINEDVDDGWLCDKGRFGYQIINSPERITQPLVRDGGELRPVSWERAMREAQVALDKGGERTAALVGGESTNEEGYLMELLMRNTLGSPHIDSRTNGAIDRDQARILARPDLSTAVWEIDHAGAVVVIGTELVEESPIFDLRVRKAARRSGTKVVIANSRPGSLDPNAAAAIRYAPGAGEAALAALAAAVSGAGAGLSDLAARAGADASDFSAAAEALSGVEGPIVVLWGERLSYGYRGEHAVSALLALARELNLAGVEGSGLIEVPVGSNGRGLREVGCVPNMRPGFAEPALEAPGKTAAEIAASMGDELTTLVLFGADPLRDYPDRDGWERALDSATNVIAFADFLNETLDLHADVVFPAESYAEKEGTVTHPDGRVQRLRQSIGHPGEVRPQRIVLMELISALLKQPLQIESSAILSEQVFAAVPFYAGLTLEEIGGRGVRWPERQAASKLDAPEIPSGPLETPPPLPSAGDGALLLGTVPTLWGGRVTEHAPTLRFLSPHQRAELSAEDGRRLGIESGDAVEVAHNGTSVRATAAVRARITPGSVFLLEGTSEDNANALANGKPTTVEVRKASPARVSDEVPGQ